MKFSATKTCLFVTMFSIHGISVSSLVWADDLNLNRPTEAVGAAEQSIQPSLQFRTGGQSPQLPPGVSPPRFPAAWGGGSTFVSGRVRADSNSAIRKAAEAVRDAKGDDAKSAGQKKLTELLNKCYDEDMIQRENELKQIEERLTKLRELLDRRRTKKQDIIELQTKVALNEAEGLGFYDGERAAKPVPSDFLFAPARIAAPFGTPYPEAVPTPPEPTSPAAKAGAR